jgi:hypothetical protein
MPFVVSTGILDMNHENFRKKLQSNARRVNADSPDVLRGEICSRYNKEVVVVDLVKTLCIEDKYAFREEQVG